jgi:hypothetical protein
MWASVSAVPDTVVALSAVRQPRAVAFNVFISLQRVRLVLVVDRDPSSHPAAQLLLPSGFSG